MATNEVRSEIKQVGVSAIRDELRGLWAVEGMAGNVVMRARSHNLIIYTEEAGEAFNELVERVIESTIRRPGRVILIRANPEGERHLESWVTLYCRPHNQQEICGELIALEASGELSEEVHSTVIALLAPDLPVYLWWMQPPDQDDHLFMQLADMADRLLVDSGCYTDLAGGLWALADLSDEPPLSDLAWARLTPWRRRVAEFWDIPSLSSALRELNAIGIEVVAREEIWAARAMLALGWMADRLGWSLVDAECNPDGGYEIHWTGGARSWVSHIRGVDAPDLPPGELSSLHIDAGQGSAALGLYYEPSRECIVIERREEHAAISRRGASFRPLDLGQALAEELDSLPDPYYLPALTQAAAIAEAAQP